MIDVYITHFVQPGHPHAVGFNEILVDQIRWMWMVDRVVYRTFVVFYGDEAAETHLRSILPSSVALVKNDRPGRPDIQPSMRNKALDCARESGCEYMVLLHNDVRVAVSWLEALTRDIQHAESLWGRAGAIVSPRHIPYHYVMGPGRRFPHATTMLDTQYLRTCEDFWGTLRATPRILSTNDMTGWCRAYGFAFDGLRVHCPAWTPPTPDGHQLMMWIARPAFFDDVGYCDENFTGINHDDQDWGIRALLAGKMNFQSQTALVGHIEGLTFYRLNSGPQLGERQSNVDLFIQKWGRAMFDEMQTGALWPRLRAQNSPKR